MNNLNQNNKKEHINDISSELIGGIKNALEKGENPIKVKQTFLNAGYKPEYVEKAMTLVLKETPQQPQETQPPQQSSQSIQTQQEQTPQSPQEQSTQQAQPQQKKQEKKLSKKQLIIMAIVAVLIIIIASVLGIFWDKIFA
jgi:cobalamin biosynthesis Mg chelatase CobN